MESISGRADDIFKDMRAGHLLVNMRICKKIAVIEGKMESRGREE